MSSLAVIDAENIDSVLGFQILGHKPAIHERMDYSVIAPWLRQHLGQPTKVIAVLREGEGAHRLGILKFWNALHKIGVQVVLAEKYAALNRVCSANSREVVDHVVCHLIDNASNDNLIYVGHDFCACEALSRQKDYGARVFAAAFSEHLSSSIVGIVDDVFDLENDIGAFRAPLPRNGHSSIGLN